MCRALLFVFVVILYAQAHAEATCPWLTQGTAATLLGGDVTVAVQVTAGAGKCEFVSNASGRSKESASGGSLRLRIEVNSSSPKKCATGEPLPGIGEDAVLCSMAVAGEQQDIIRGRVRNTYFLLELRTPETNANDEALHRTALERIAEAVTGNLF